MTRRDKTLASDTFWVLGIYAPVETWASWPDLHSPYYVVDLIAMILLAWGVFESRRGRVGLALGLFAGGWGWLGANGWRATADRFELLGEGGTLELGAAEMGFVVCGTIASIVGLIWSLRAPVARGTDLGIQRSHTAQAALRSHSR